jgi:hypothetical protein
MGNLENLENLENLDLETLNFILASIRKIRNGVKNKKYYEAHKEEISARKREWYKKYRALHKEELRARARKFYWNHREEIRQKRKGK